MTWELPFPRQEDTLWRELESVLGRRRGARLSELERLLADRDLLIEQHARALQAMRNRIEYLESLHGYGVEAQERPTAHPRAQMPLTPESHAPKEDK